MNVSHVPVLAGQVGTGPGRGEALIPPAFFFLSCLRVPNALSGGWPTAARLPICAGDSPSPRNLWTLPSAFILLDNQDSQAVLPALACASPVLALIFATYFGCCTISRAKGVDATGSGCCVYDERRGRKLHTGRKCYDAKIRRRAGKKAARTRSDWRRAVRWGRVAGTSALV